MMDENEKPLIFYVVIELNLMVIYEKTIFVAELYQGSLRMYGQFVLALGPIS